MTNTNKETAKSYTSAEIKNIEKSQVEIKGVIATEVWEKFRTQAMKTINESITVAGFRKGMIPENILVSKVGESAIHEEMAELALSKAYIEILIDNKIDAIGKPTVQVTKLAKGNPLEFKATTAVMPKITLPDYKTLSAKEVNKKSPDELKVTDKDVEDSILRIRKSHASHEGHDHKKMTAEEPSFAEATEGKHDKAIEASMPELTDDFVKKLGDFNDVPDFKVKLAAMIAENKKDEAREKLRIRIADSIADATKIELPEVMLESELNRTQKQFESDIERMGVKMEDYLKHAKKTIEDIRKEWIPHAEKKAKLQLVLNAIADAEKIKPDQKDIEIEVDHIVEHYKDADREQAAVYAETVLTNEKVFQFLEIQK